MEIKLLGEHIGAVVEGVDIRASIDEGILVQLRAALCQYAVLVFRGQAVTDAEHVAFSEGFGAVELTLPNDPIVDGGPVGVLANVDEREEIIPPQDLRMLYTLGNALWHSDGSFRTIPLRVSLLAAKVVPPEGGETEFASLTAAYAALSDGRKALLERLAAEHSLAHSRAQIAPNLLSAALLQETPPVVHPLVRSIPETGASALLVGSYATRVIGWPLEQGQELLQELLEWSTQPRFVYRHSWRADDLVVYDNRCSLHRGRPWHRGKYKRILHRTTIAGDAAD
ncbi:MAG: TauD/TfdA family dioxygenase [Candidatus Latescibacterota bacterium]|nr:TauD/TfdA family dioxygenase [Candidatus Latescibacterota bacterium]